ncbi:MAG: aldolase/citrate lyase family protein, partial [Pseudomonadota bacterium]
MRFILITNQPEIAAYAADQGVNLVMLDLEVLGKADRQGHVDSWKSHHQIDELPALRAALPPGRLMVRINPLNPGSKAEIDAVVAAGADWIMVPMFRSAQELSALKALIAGRARLMPLVETVGALASISAWSALRPDAVHFGLNDLHLELGSDFMFQPLADDTLAGPCAALRAEGIPFGIGGVAKAGEG